MKKTRKHTISVIDEKTSTSQHLLDTKQANSITPPQYGISALDQTCNIKRSHDLAQTKLKISRPNDQYEQQADFVAEKVTNMDNCSAAPSPVTQSILSKSNHGEDVIARQSHNPHNAGNETSTKITSDIQSLQDSGKPLSSNVRNYFEPRFGSDFSQVKVHHDKQAATLANRLNARAFTVGNTIFFGNDQYKPDTHAGKKLLAHELTHTLQQSHHNENIIQRDPRDITFDDDEGSFLYHLRRSGRDPYDVIQDYVSAVSTALNNMRVGELNAIEQFLTHMSFSSSDDAQPDVLGAVFKYVGKQLWEAALSAVPSVGGISATQIFGFITAMTDELERAAAAQQSYNLATFMVTLRNQTAAFYQSAITELQASKRSELDLEFSSREGEWSEGEVWVSGDKARLLSELEAQAQAMLRAVPEPIAYEEALIVRWVRDRNAGAQTTDAFRTNGIIELKYDTEETDSGYNYTFESAKLFAATQSGQAADMLTRVMSHENKKVYELGIPVRVMLKTENMMPGGRSYFGAWIRSRTDYDRTTIIGWGPADRAWNAMPWSVIDSVRRVRGG